ncbi:MAG: hypothetical protein KDI90_11595 [Alphaproteobacteria bacterium]|nr:hypothetical protein [Alphaproteobacteria bacterium]MCB9975839.1 hypothetical protein [Rhodospirillales bacterium]
MFKTGLFTSFIALAFVFSFSSVVQAEEGAGVSYAKKKQGQVHFVEKENQAEEEGIEISSDSGQDPSSIEPAAGLESDEDAEENRAAEMIKLPRK